MFLGLLKTGNLNSTLTQTEWQLATHRAFLFRIGKGPKNPQLPVNNPVSPYTSTIYRKQNANSFTVKCGQSTKTK